MFFLYVIENGKPCPQTWRDDPRKFSSWESYWEPRVPLAPVKLEGVKRVLSLDQLAAKYPCPAPKEDA